jgi:hypothetical protein
MPSSFASSATWRVRPRCLFDWYRFGAEVVLDGTCLLSGRLEFADGPVAAASGKLAEIATVFEKARRRVTRIKD